MGFRNKGLKWPLLAILVLPIIGFYGVSIRPGMPWADDWATYLQDALNLLQSKRYSACRLYRQSRSQYWSPRLSTDVSVDADAPDRTVGHRL